MTAATRALINRNDPAGERLRALTILSRFLPMPEGRGFPATKR